MSKKRRRVWIGLAILVVSCVLLLWGLWPFLPEVRVLLFTPENMRLPIP
ncbi:MAG: hypothetical protein ABWK53_00835 [Anaerolineales bacterium]